MNNIKKVAKFVSNHPGAPSTETLLELAVALETGDAFSFNKLYDLDRETYKLAMGMVDDWRLDRHYLSKLTLLDHVEVSNSLHA